MESFFITIYYFIIKTPIWVYILMAYLLFIGFKASRTRTVSLVKLCIVPIVFVGLSIHSLILVMHTSSTVLISWLIGLAIGSAIGWLLVHRLHPQVDKKHWLIHLPGSWTTLALMILIFSFKYYLGYTTAVHPEYLDQVGFADAMMAISAICTGCFIGRVLYYARLFYTEPSVNLR